MDRIDLVPWDLGPLTPSERKGGTEPESLSDSHGTDRDFLRMGTGAGGIEKEGPGRTRRRQGRTGRINPRTILLFLACFSAHL